MDQNALIQLLFGGGMGGGAGGGMGQPQGGGNGQDIWQQLLMRLFAQRLGRQNAGPSPAMGNPLASNILGRPQPQPQAQPQPSNPMPGPGGVAPGLTRQPFHPFAGLFGNAN